MNATQAELVDERAIDLPYKQNGRSIVAVDIGGTLAKVVHFVKNQNSAADAPSEQSSTGGCLNFHHFETQNIEMCVDFIRQLASKDSGIILKATGGGSYKFAHLLEATGVKCLEKEDEMDCLITGLSFLISEVKNEVFTYSDSLPIQYEVAGPPSSCRFPYLLVNIGSGVSILKVDSPSSFQRVSGSSLGGGTLWGLLKVLTRAETFDDMLKMSESGDNRTVDMMVGDIYGTDYSKVGLSASTIASSFGKVFRMPLSSSRDSDTENLQLNPSDVAKSLLFMVSNNIGQIAYLNAKVHNVKNIYFGGSYIRGHPETMRTLSFAVKYWSNSSMQAYFLRHESYLGALGAYLKGDQIQ
ncbi:hypothetical protein MIR68_003411 [Amoeboaphelidium protococcarum]|nr:hypothetical protein MIR68_003411 [Amoeboaphelidium protococcarum]